MFKQLRNFVVLGLLVGSSAVYANYNGCSILEPCSWGVALKGGVAPGYYTTRGPVWLTAPLAPTPVFTSSNTTRFEDQFSLPWEVAAEVTWNASDRVQLFLEGVYQQGDGKTHSFVSGPINVTQRYTNFKTWGGYLGTRYYFSFRQFCSIMPFIGFKAGILHQSSVQFNEFLFGVQDLSNATYFSSQWAPSVGVQVGLDYEINHNWSVTFAAEAVATQGPKNNRNVVLNPALAGGLTNANIGDTGKIVSYPVTLGLGYNF